MRLGAAVDVVASAGRKKFVQTQRQCFEANCRRTNYVRGRRDEDRECISFSVRYLDSEMVRLVAAIHFKFQAAEAQCPFGFGCTSVRVGEFAN
jgi:hypothetical protein